MPQYQINKITGLIIGLCLSSSAFGQSGSGADYLERFILQLRTFDLNAVTENGFSITNIEYRRLQQSWDKLSVPQKRKFLRGSTTRLDRSTFVLVLVYDINSRKTWQAHTEHLLKYNARGCSITLSRFDSFVSLQAARKRLADFLFVGPCLVRNGRLSISKAIKEQAVLRNDGASAIRLEKWERMINHNQNVTEQKKVFAVNSFFNQEIRPQTDFYENTETDYWQSPVETLVQGSGDCEDFAMAKYISLRLLGMPAKRLQIAIVRSMTGPGLHAVLLVYPKCRNVPLVLDNVAFSKNGFFDTHILPLADRQGMHRFCLQWGVNEDRFIIFKRGIRSYLMKKNPTQLFPRFGLAIVNSRRLLDGIAG